MGSNLHLHLHPELLCREQSRKIQIKGIVHLVLAVPSSECYTHASTHSPGPRRSWPAPKALQDKAAPHSFVQLRLPLRDRRLWVLSLALNLVTGEPRPTWALLCTQILLSSGSQFLSLHTKRPWSCADRDFGAGKVSLGEGSPLLIRLCTRVSLCLQGCHRPTRGGRRPTTLGPGPTGPAPAQTPGQVLCPAVLLP